MQKYQRSKKLYYLKVAWRKKSNPLNSAIPSPEIAYPSYPYILYATHLCLFTLCLQLHPGIYLMESHFMHYTADLLFSFFVSKVLGHFF